MHELRQLYRPVQPTIRASASEVRYTELPPNESLLDTIYCYWSLHTTRSLEDAFQYRVVADGCIDIYFELTSPGDSWVMGFCKKYTEFLLDQQFHYIGIRFLPTMFPQLFHVDASELSNRYEELRLVAPAMAEFIASECSPELSLQDIAQKLDAYFLQMRHKTHFNEDHRFYGALATILQNQGMVNVEKDLDTGLSSRQMRRLFQYYIGDTAKTFSQVVRFQNILRAKPSQQSLRHNKLFYDTGYYDQAHFIKEFKNLYGVTPGKAFGRE